MFLSARRKWLAMPISLVGVVGRPRRRTLTLIGRGAATTFGGSYVVDNFALLFQVFFLIGGDRGAGASRSGTSARAASTRGSTTSCC